MLQIFEQKNWFPQPQFGIRDVPVYNFIVKGSKAVQINSSRQNLLYGSIIQGKIVKSNQGPLLPLSTNCMVGSSLDFQRKKSFNPRELATQKTLTDMACKAGLVEPMVKTETTPLLSVKCKIHLPLNELIGLWESV